MWPAVLRRDAGEPSTYPPPKSYSTDPPDSPSGMAAMPPISGRVGSGSGLSEEPAVRVWSRARRIRVVLSALPDLVVSASSVGDELAVDRVAEAPFQGAQGFLGAAASFGSQRHCGRAFSRPRRRPSDATSTPSRLQKTLHQGNLCSVGPHGRFFPARH
jgi:hypothetical protein